MQWDKLTMSMKFIMSQGDLGGVKSLGKGPHLLGHDRKREPHPERRSYVLTAPASKKGASSYDT